MPKFTYLGDYSALEEAGKVYQIGDTITLSATRVAEIRGQGKFRFERSDEGDDQSAESEMSEHFPISANSENYPPSADRFAPAPTHASVAHTPAHESPAHESAAQTKADDKTK